MAVRELYIQSELRDPDKVHQGNHTDVQWVGESQYRVPSIGPASDEGEHIRCNGGFGIL